MQLHASHQDYTQLLAKLILFNPLLSSSPLISSGTSPSSSSCRSNTHFRVCVL